METIKKALNNCVTMDVGPTEQKIRSALDSLQRLISELERPEYRELVTFAVSWEKLGRELTALKLKIGQRKAEKPISSVDEFLKKLIKKD